MAPRLLSLLTLIEESMSGHRASLSVKPAIRTVNFHKGLARLTFADSSGSILLQNFVLADGQLCIKALLSWAGSEAVVPHSIYPQGSFNWQGAADKLAALWLAGPPPTSVGEVVSPAHDEPASTGLRNLAAAG